MSYKIDSVKYIQEPDDRLGAALGFDAWRRVVGWHPTAGEYYTYSSTPNIRAQENSDGSIT